MQQSVIFAVFSALFPLASAVALPWGTPTCPGNQKYSFGKCGCDKGYVIDTKTKNCVKSADAAAGAGPAGPKATADASVGAPKLLTPKSLASVDLNKLLILSIDGALAQSSELYQNQPMAKILSPSFYSECCSYFNTTTVQTNFVDQSVLVGNLAHSDFETWSKAEALTSNTKFLGRNKNVQGAMIASYCNDDTCRPTPRTYSSYSICPTGLGKTGSICKVSLTLSKSQIDTAIKTASASASAGWSQNFAQYVSWQYTSVVSSTASTSFLCIGEGGITKIDGTPVESPVYDSEPYYPSLPQAQ